VLTRQPVLIFPTT